MSRGLNQDVAIVGMACVLPGAKDLQRYWENILAKKDCISDPPPDWEADFYYDPDSSGNDRTYCKRGGYLGALADFDPMQYGVMPNAVDGAEPDHFLALRAAYDALADAGYKDNARFRERTEVIIGRGTYVNRGNANALQHSVMVDGVMRVLKQLHPEHSDEELARIKHHLKASLPAFHADTAPGLVPNIISGRICNRLDLMGSNYIVDAACASSLVAFDLAVRDLQTQRCDMAVAGGVNASVPPVITIIFSQLKALSRQGMIRPFSGEADGTLLAEGVGMLVLKRLADAERDQDRIYAVIKGVGTASDGRAIGLLAPRFEGEELALKRAYEAAGVDPATVGMIEAHGTATPVGDAVEMDALRSVFGARRGEAPHCAVGSVKSMIGHTMPASGAAGVIKAALALHHKVLPPTIHCENPNSKLELEKSDFYINSETRPWIHSSSTHPRRAGVNAFGFGGINAHLVLEEYTGTSGAPNLQHTWDNELFIVSAEKKEDLLAEAEATLQLVGALDNEVLLKDLAWTMNCGREHGPARLAIVAESRADLTAKLQLAIGRLQDPRTKRIRDAQGIYFFSEPLAPGGGLAFVFPGENAQYPNMLSDLCMHFPEVRAWFDLMDQAFENHSRGYLLSDAVFPPPMAGGGQRLMTMDVGAEAVFCGNQAMYALLTRLGIRPDAMVGHSAGEHSSLLAAGVVKADDRDSMIRHILGVNRVFEELNANNGIREGVLLTVAGTGRAELESLVARHEENLFIALDNCPHQVVLFGTEKSIQSTMDALAGKAAICQKLPFGRAYHTPWFDVFAKSLEGYFETLPMTKPAVPLYSCVTAGLYPSEVTEIRRLAAVQWASMVRFRETVENMYRDGTRIFVEVGPRNNLTGFLDDIMRGKQYLAVPSNVQHRSGILQMHHLLAQLVAHRVPVRLEHLYERRAPQTVTTGAKPPAKRKMMLSMGLQPFRLPADFETKKPAVAAKPAAAAASVPVAAAVTVPAPVAPLQPREAALSQHLQTMQQFLASQQQVMAAYLATRQTGRVAPQAAIAAPAPLPFITEVVEMVPGVRAKARHTYSLNRDVLFGDHRLGRNVSQEDASLKALSIVPLTVTMELLAEGGALLAPGKVLVGMREVRASRWISLERGECALEIEAQIAGDANAVHVRIFEGNAGPIRPVWVEGTMLFADRYPQAPQPRQIRLEDDRPSAWKSEDLYVEGMFHGPSFQAVHSMDRTGSNGTVATMEVLPRHELIAGLPDPKFLMDPVILDAAGQVVAFWSQEQLQASGDIFPYRLESLQCFMPLQALGTRLECRVVAKHVSATDIHTDIEIVDAQGRLHYRLENWEDRRFTLPKPLWQMRIAPKSAYLAERWALPLPSLPAQEQPVCCRITGLNGLLETSTGIWTKVLAYLVLSRSEREEWFAMNAVDKRREEWLLGRCAAKDAVRMLIKQRFGVDLCPADVRIVPDSHRRPNVQGAWVERLGVHPVVSLSHTAGTAVAIAALDPNWLLGIDIESLSRGRGTFEGLAFVDQEKQMLTGLGAAQPEWFLRLWCAKESVAKALGHGLVHGLHSLCATEVKTDSGVVEVEVRNGMLQQFPEWHGRRIAAHTARHEDFVCSMVYQRR